MIYKVIYSYPKIIEYQDDDGGLALRTKWVKTTIETDIYKTFTTEKEAIAFANTVTRKSMKNGKPSIEVIGWNK